jgi:hypothetical protein
MYVASNTTANNFELHRSMAKNVINLTRMHAHVANVLKNSYNESESEYMLCTLLAYGVTTIRNPGGPTEQSVALREYVERYKDHKFLPLDDCLIPQKSRYLLLKNKSRRNKMLDMKFETK